MSAPTTAEVRRALAAEWHSAREHGDSEANGAAAALEAYALPIAEHRDALAAEVARLRAEIRSAHERIDLCAEEPIDATWTWPLSRRIDALDSLVDTIARKEERDEAQALYSELRAERDAARTELAAVKAERDALAAEVARLKAQKNIHDSEVPRHLSARQVDECDAARLRAILECGSSPYGVHRCCHCDSEVT